MNGTKNESKHDRPSKISLGSLYSNQDYLLLHNRHAIALFEGRAKRDDKPEIFGVSRFAGSVAQIIKAAGADDPWADWWLIKIDEKIALVRTSLDEYRDKLKTLYPRNKNIHISAPQSNDPKRKPLDFGVPTYPFQLSYLIADFDDLCSMAAGLAHHGLITKAKKERYINLMGRPIRAAMLSAVGYRYQGVTRNDLVANNPKAQKANLLMGDVPEDVLQMRRRSPWAPVLKQYEQSTINEDNENEPDTNSPAPLDINDHNKLANG